MSANFYLIVCSSISIIAILISSCINYKRYRCMYEKRLKTDITTTQMIALEEKINNFLKEKGLKPGQSIHDIAKVLSVRERIDKEMNDNARLSGENVEGEKEAIFKFEEHDFELAHEIGHLINGDPLPATRPVGWNKDESEQKADYIGAALLMPKEFVFKDIENYKYVHATKQQKYKIIRQLAGKYGVSQIMALRRVTEIQQIYAIK